MLLVGCPSSGTETPTRIDWTGPFSTLQVRELEIDADGKVFTAPSLVTLEGDYINEDHVQFQALWQEHGVEMRLRASFARDSANWWAESIWHYDGHAAPGVDWVEYTGSYMQAPLGIAFEGDLVLPTLRLRDVTATAFMPPCKGNPYTIEPVALRLDLPNPASTYSFGIFLRDGDCERTGVPPGMRMDWSVQDTSIATVSLANDLPLEPFAARQYVNAASPGMTGLSIKLLDSAGTLHAEHRLEVLVNPEPN